LLSIIWKFRDLDEDYSVRLVPKAQQVHTVAACRNNLPIAEKQVSNLPDVHKTVWSLKEVFTMPTMRRVPLFVILSCFILLTFLQIVRSESSSTTAYSTTSGQTSSNTMGQTSSNTSLTIMSTQATITSTQRSSAGSGPMTSVCNVMIASATVLIHRYVTRLWHHLPPTLSLRAFDNFSRPICLNLNVDIAATIWDWTSKLCGFPSCPYKIRYKM